MEYRNFINRGTSSLSASAGTSAQTKSSYESKLREKLLATRHGRMNSVNFRETGTRATTTLSGVTNQSYGSLNATAYCRRPVSVTMNGADSNASGSRRRSLSGGSRTPPPVLRRRMSRPGRPVIPQNRIRERSLSPDNVKRITSRVMGTRPQTAFARSNRLNSTVCVMENSSIKHRSLRSRIEDVSMRNESSFVSGVNRTIDNTSRIGLERAMDALRHHTHSVSILNRPREGRAGIAILSRGPNESDISLEDHPSLWRPSSAPDPLRYMNRSIREMARSPSSSTSSILSMGDASLGRRERVISEMSQRSREFFEANVVNSPRRVLADKGIDDHQIRLESMDIVRSSVSSICQAAKPRSAEVAKTETSCYGGLETANERKSELTDFELGKNEVEELRELRGDEEEVHQGTELRETEAQSLSEKIRNQSELIERLVSVHTPSPEATPPRDLSTKGPQMFAIATPLEDRPATLTEAVSPVNLFVDMSPCEASEAILPDEALQTQLEFEVVPIESETIGTTNVTPPLIPEPVLFREITDKVLEADFMALGPAEPVVEILAPPIEESKDQVIEEVNTPEDVITEELLDELITSVLKEGFLKSERTVTRIPEPVVEWKLPIRVDSFDIAPESMVDSSRQGPGYIDVDVVITTVKRALPGISESDELDDDQLHCIRTTDWKSILSAQLSSVPESLILCVSDTLVWLLDSLPPAAAADRAWAAKCPGTRHPMSSFLPQRHTIGTLCKDLADLINEHNQPVSDEQVRIDAICNEFVKKFNLDDVLFQHMSDEEEAAENARIEEEIYGEVSSFILEAVVTSVASDFDIFQGRRAVMSS